MEESNDKEFWNFVNKTNWTEDLNFERINREIKQWKYWNKEFIKKMKKIYYKKHNILHSLFNPYFWKINFSDDSLDDFIADIIWNGEDYYNNY